jgi:hypothetical protein
MRERRTEVCDCGHGAGLHDRHGCAAYLGAFAETASHQRYCTCRRSSGEALSLTGVPAYDARQLVGTVRIRERGGSAIAVCEDPPALELGSSVGEVLDRIKLRLRDAVPAGLGAPGYVVVVRERSEASDISIEALA